MNLIEKIPQSSGIYLLIMSLKKDNITIETKSRKKFNFTRGGYYVYVGSAMNGLRFRISRYFKKIKKRHWHIDYIIPYMKILKIICVLCNDKIFEKILAQALSKYLNGIEGFGSTDTKIKTHLFHDENLNKIETVIKKVLNDYRLNYIELVVHNYIKKN